MDRAEIRRLQKAARDNNKLALAEWGTQFEDSIRRELEYKLNIKYENDLVEAIDNLIVAICFTGVFSESTAWTKDNINEYMSDLFASLDMFRRGEYNVDDYVKQLKEYGIDLDDIITHNRERNGNDGR